MKRILVLGAGQSTPYLIHYLLQHAEENDWQVTVGDIDRDLAKRRIAGHSRGTAIRFDVNDELERSTQIEWSDVVINMLSPAYQDLVAWDCVANGRHMLSVSYRDRSMREVGRDARRKGVLLLCELGLDPGIDHMSAMAVITRVRDASGRIVRFCSYGSGIPAPNQEHNPLRYVITWNPRNVVMASEQGAQYMENSKLKIVPWHHVFHHTWPVEVDGLGVLEAYPNRDSIAYMRTFGLDDVRTMIRGTLRYPGWSETWEKIVRLGLPNENMRIPNLSQRSYAEVTEMFLPMTNVNEPLEVRVARFLQISPTGRIMEDLRWIGLFSDEEIGCEGETPASMMIHLLKRKLPLLPGMRDMVVVMHELDVEYGGAEKKRERITSTLVAEGEENGFTAMAKTVGLPTALAAELLLQGNLELVGSHIPTHPSIYEPVLQGLARAGLEFTEKTEPLE